MIVQIIVDGDTGRAFKPFPETFAKLLAVISGRKTWKQAFVSFDATPANIRKMNAFDGGFKLEWTDPTGKLAALETLQSLPTQHSAPKEMGREAPPYRAEGLPLKEWMTACMAQSWDRKAFALFLEQGLAKTAVLIHNAGMLHLKGKLTGVLVVAKSGAHEQWIEEEIPKVLDAFVKRKLILWKGKRPAVNYEDDTLTFFSMNSDALRTENGYAAAREFLLAHHGKVMMILDESQEFKNYGSGRTKAALKLRDLATYRRIATGTPLAKNMLDYWSQFMFLDPDILGHRYMTSFRSRYCVMGGWENRSVVGAQNVEEFYALIAPHSFRMTKAECTDLPPKIYQQVVFEMSDAEKKQYKIMREEMMVEIDGHTIDAPHAAARMVRLQQISCGFLPADNDNTVDLGSSRLDCMTELIEGLEGPVLIWARFNEDIRRITARLAKEYGSGSVGTYYGPTSKKDRRAAKLDWLAGSVRFLVASPAAGGTGLNLQGECQNVIYYSNDFSALNRWQSEDRTHRLGMLGAVTYFDLIARGSPDRHILANLRAKRNISSLTLDEIRMAIAA